VIEEGKPAPDFELPTDNGETLRLPSLRGKPVVLYFYPKDNTSGCTTQACGIRDAWGEFARAGAVVLGEPGRAQRLEAADRRRNKTEEQALDDQPDDVAKPDHPVKHQKIHIRRQSHERAGGLPADHGSDGEPPERKQHRGQSSGDHSRRRQPAGCGKFPGLVTQHTRIVRNVGKTAGGRRFRARRGALGQTQSSRNQPASNQARDREPGHERGQVPQ